MSGARSGIRVIGKRRREERLEGIGIGRDALLAQLGGRLGPGADGSLPGQQLVGDHGEREDIGTRPPLSATDSFGRRVGPSDRPTDPDVLQRRHHAEPGRPRGVWCHEDVARVQRAVLCPNRAGTIDGAREL